MTRQQLADDLRAQIADDPTQFVFEGGFYIGGWTGLTNRKELQLGGYEPHADSVLVVPLLDQYGNPTFNPRAPVVKSLITIKGKEYRVERTETDAKVSSLQMDLVTNDV